MKRVLCILFLLLLTLPMLASCHGKMRAPEVTLPDEPDTDKPQITPFDVPDEFDTERQHEITFWAKNDTNMTQVSIYHQAIADFEALYPNVKVKLKLYTDYGRIYQDVLTNIATSTTPNVCITYPDHIATYMTGEDNVVPLDSLFFDEKYGLAGSELRYDGPEIDAIVPKFLEECKLGDNYYAIPFMRSTEACYVNKTYVEALGYELPEVLTWDFLWEVSEAAMKKDADGNFIINGQKTLIPCIYKSTDNMMISMLKQLDAGYSTDDGEILLFNDTTRELLKEIASHAETRAFSTFKISSYPANFLNAGQCIFAIDSTAGATWMGSNAPLIDISEEKLVHFETVVLPIPQFDTENPYMISQGPSMCIFNKEDEQEVLASWLFAQYMITNDVQIAYSQTEGYVPVTLKAQESEEYLDYLSRSGEDNDFYYSIKLDAVKLMLNNIDRTFTTPVFNGSTSLRNAAGQLVEDVTKSVRRKQTVNDGYITKLYSEIKSLYSLQTSDASEAFPIESVILLSALAGAWVLIILYVVFQKLKNRKNFR